MDVSITIVSQVPAGTSLDFRGNTVPFGFLAEDGALVSRVTYARLFASIGTSYGAGDGSTTFKLPDSRGRVNIGSGTGSGLTARVLAATGGEETHVLTEPEMPSHTHVQNPHNHTQNPHNHTLSGQTNTLVTGSGVPAGNIMNQNGGTFTMSSTTATNNDSTATNQNTGGGAAHNNMQPFLVATKIIKY